MRIDQDTMRIELLPLGGSRDDVKLAVERWMLGAALTAIELGFVESALRLNAAEQALNTGFTSDRFEPQTIEVGA